MSRHDGVWYYVAPWPTRNTPPTSATTNVPWCIKNAEHYNGREGNANARGENAAFGKVRCPHCGRRLQLMTVDSEHGYGHFMPYLPPHKLRKLAVQRKQKRALKRDRGSRFGRR
jgi:hypothetical protein